MSTTTELIVRSIVIGGGATMTIDLWAAGLRRLGVSSLDFALLGRWIGHLPSGRFIHERIAQTAPVRGERLIGWGAHYSIGVGLAALWLAIGGSEWARSPTLAPAVVFGAVTVAAPWLILQPALGAGIASSKTPAPLFNALKSMITHIVFGIGLYLAAQATTSLAAFGD